MNSTVPAQMCSSFARLKEVIFENAFIIQGNSPEELPEQVLAAVRMYRIDMTRSRPLRDFITPSGLTPAGSLGQNWSIGSHQGNGLAVAGGRSLPQAPSLPAPIPESADER